MYLYDTSKDSKPQKTVQTTRCTKFQLLLLLLSCKKLQECKTYSFRENLGPFEFLSLFLFAPFSLDPGSLSLHLPFLGGLQHASTPNGKKHLWVAVLLNTNQIVISKFLQVYRMIDPCPSTNQSISLKSGSLFLVMVSVRPYIHVRTYVQNKANQSNS